MGARPPGPRVGVRLPVICGRWLPPVAYLMPSGVAIETVAGPAPRRYRCSDGFGAPILPAIWPGWRPSDLSSRGYWILASGWAVGRPIARPAECAPPRGSRVGGAA